MQANAPKYKKERRDKLIKVRAKKISTEDKRREVFRDSIKDGRTYECVSCHRLCFKNGVVVFTELLKTKFKFFSQIIEKNIGAKENTKSCCNHYICTTCKNYISKRRMPPMSNENNLQLMDLSGYEELQLTELENSMIALNIIFQKVFKLPRSRWPAMKDKTVNIPIFEADILNTIESLPRTPSQAGIIPINFKRRLKYKNSHLTQYISVPKIMKALITLKELGNPYYQFIPYNINFEDDCRENDLEGFQFIYPEDEITEDDVDILEKSDENETESKVEKEEEEYQTHDSVKKWQFNYNRSTCFSDNYPEISYKEDSNKRIAVAPGEGKCPSNILQEKDWDLKSFPCLLPDGKNSLQTEREVKISDQDYFTQRIMNKDPRFATNPAYVFAAVAYLEKKQIEGRKGISFKRGKATKLLDGTSSYSLEDPYSVLDNVKNTPRYWQKTRYELLARLENLGAFQYFFTLSCADTRWPENFAELLKDQKVRYEVKDFKEEVSVMEEPGVWMSLEEFLKKNESKHEFIRKNLLNATLTFHQRVKMFVKHIIMSKASPMCIQYNSYKVEFALRGAGHIHGVLWVDWDNFTALEPDKTRLICEAFNNIREDEEITDLHKEVLSEFADLFISCSLKNPRTKHIVEVVQRHNHTKACRKYGTKCRFYYPRFPSLKTIVSVPFNKLGGSEKDQTEKLEKSKALLNKVVNILEDDEIMVKIMNIGIELIDEYINMQKAILELEALVQNSKTNKATYIKITDNLQIILAKCLGLDTALVSKTQLETILENLKNKFEDFKDQIKQVELDRLQALLDEAGIISEEGTSAITLYEEALGISQTGYKIIHKRDVNEIFINNYNPEWIINWNGNMDLQLCLDYYAVITYISDYYSKDDSGTMGHIKEALKKAGNESLQSKLSLVVHTFLTHRQIGECEAFFRILPHLHMKSSNIDTVFVTTGFKCNRVGFLKELTEKEAKKCKNVIKVLNKKGLFTEKPSLLDKFERKDLRKNSQLNKLSYNQFCMKYSSSNSEPKKDDFKSAVFCRGDNNWEITQAMDLIVTHDFEVSKEHYSLPNMIQLTNLRPDEPRYMKKRSRQVVRMHKINRTKHPHEYIYAQLQMFAPFKKEDDLSPDDFEKCKDLYNKKSDHNDKLRIENVKCILMKHLESVEAGTERAEEIRQSNIGDTMDPQLEQDNADCDDIGVKEHDDFIFKDPTDLSDITLEVKRYKAIDVYDEYTLDLMSINLDEDQRIVLETGVNYAKSIVKAKKSKEAPTPTPLLIVQGGAGTGKSTVIDVLSQQMERILRTPGDNPDHPYIIKAAFTGTAAANIKGQTLHGAFSFSFGNDFYSLGDKTRDERRSQLENLLVVIIDEFSMMKSDMLYQLDLRLREVKQMPDVVFGGVSVFLFGDILQLRPVLANYIFDEPKNERYLLAFLVGSLWKMFNVVILKHNHRQGEDQKYADLLNRIRVGEVNEEDVITLETRVRPWNHPDIPHDALVVTCTNVEVNQINEDRLQQIDSPEYVIDSINKTNTQKQFKPRTDASGAIKGTPLQKQLKLKVGAKVMLTYNIDTCDCLTNGAFGEVLGYEFNKNGNIQKVYVNFYAEDCGKERRKNCVALQDQFPGRNVTPIELIEFQYSLSRKGNQASATAIALQFPLKLAFAATAHKVQGMTVKKPNYLVVDLRTVREAAQAYVILSRVQALSQLFILVAVSAHKIKASGDAMIELERMKEVSLGYRPDRNNSLLSCNIRSIQKNFVNFVSSSALKTAQLICLQETWLDPLAPNIILLETNGWHQHNNSVGRGKGITTFYKQNFVWEADVTKLDYQITKIKSEAMDVINLYRSAGAENTSFLEDLCALVSSVKPTVIVGDFNMCYRSEKYNNVFEVIRNLGFKQLVQYPTHTEGRLIDLVFVFSPDQNTSYEVLQQAQYYTDHDLIQVFVGKYIVCIN